MGCLETFIRHRVVEILLAAVLGTLLVGLMQYGTRAATHLAQHVAVEQRIAREHTRVIQQTRDQQLNEEWHKAAQAWQDLLRDDRSWQAPSLPEVEVLSVSTVPLSDQARWAHATITLQGPFDVLMAWLEQISTNRSIRRMTSLQLEYCTSCQAPRYWQLQAGLIHGLDEKGANT